jgi:VWFA-related protein
MRKSFLALLLAVVVCLAGMAIAQSSGQEQKPPDQQKVPEQQESEQQKPPAQKPPVDVSGPDRPVGQTVTVPRRPPTKKTAPKTPVNVENPGGQPYAISTSVDLVSVDVIVQDKDGHFIPGLGKKNFRVLEDNVPQAVQTFAATEAPMTVVMLIEFNNLYQSFWSETWYQTLTAAYGFVQSLRPEDWIAVVAYDLRPEIIQDFTQNKQMVQASMGRLRYPGFSEANLYDALTDVLDRLEDVEGKKGVVLISTGIDTFSKLTYDQMLKRLKGSEVPVFPIGMMQVLRMRADAAGMLGPIANLDFIQADNAMRTFAALTGGAAYFPRFYGEFPEIYQNISARMRNQYTLGYASTNTAKDGKFRKLKVELVDEQGRPLKAVDQKGKALKLVVIARAGYYAPKGEVTVQ